MHVQRCRGRGLDGAIDTVVVGGVRRKVHQVPTQGPVGDKWV